MNVIYVLFAIVGTGLVAASLLGAIDHDFGGDFAGDHSSDFGGDAGHGAGGDHGSLSPANEWHGHHASGDGNSHGFAGSIPFLSVRFWIYAAAAFGLIGVLLSARRRRVRSGPSRCRGSPVVCSQERSCGSYSW